MFSLYDEKNEMVTNDYSIVGLIEYVRVLCASGKYRVFFDGIPVMAINAIYSPPAYLNNIQLSLLGEGWQEQLFFNEVH